MFSGLALNCSLLIITLGASQRVAAKARDGRIPSFKGVWANKPTEQECHEELREVLEGWILLNIADHTPLPIVDGMTLEVGKLV